MQTSEKTISLYMAYTASRMVESLEKLKQGQQVVKAFIRKITVNMPNVISIVFK